MTFGVRVRAIGTAVLLGWLSGWDPCIARAEPVSRSRPGAGQTGTTTSTRTGPGACIVPDPGRPPRVEPATRRTVLSLYARRTPVQQDVPAAMFEPRPAGPAPRPRKLPARIGISFKGGVFALVVRYLW